jgi:hypothetical protein
VIAVEKGKKCVVPKTEMPALDSGVRMMGLGLEDVVSVRAEGAEEVVVVRIWSYVSLGVDEGFGDGTHSDVSFEHQISRGIKIQCGIDGLDLHWGDDI